MLAGYERKIELLLGLIIVIAVVSALLGIPEVIIAQSVPWLLSAIVGTVLSMMAGAMSQAFTGRLLETIFFTIEIGGFKFSITTFTIVTFVVKLYFFEF
jgi:hypothetical protein